MPEGQKESGPEKTNNMTCAPNEDSDQQGQCLFTFLAVHLNKVKIFIATYLMHSEGYDKTGQMPSLI